MRCTHAAARLGRWNALRAALRAVFLTALLAVTLAPRIAAAQDPYDFLNRARLESNCGASTNAALTRSAELERAAQAISRGQELTPAIRQTGYRSTRSNLVRLSGQASANTLLATLVKRYCAQLNDAAFTEIGIHQQTGLLIVVLAAPFSPNVALSQEDAGKRVLDLVNQTRAVARICGDKSFGPAPPLTYNTVLARAALTHAADMALNNYFSHDGRDGSTPAQRVERAGYRYRTTGENLAAGMNTPERAVEGWIRSPPHCANLMNPNYAEMGVAYAIGLQSDMGVYWAQSFGRPR